MNQPGPAANAFTRILSFAVVTGAALVLILCLVGIIGVWAANTPVTQAILNTVKPLISALKTAEGAMQEVNQGMGSVTEIVGSLEELLNSAGLVKNLLPGVVEGIQSFSSSLANLQTTLEDSGGKVVAARGLLEVVEASVTRWVDLLSIILTVVLLWLAFSQASLFINGWRYATGVDLLVKRAPLTVHASETTIEESTGSQSGIQKSKEE